MNRQIGQLFVFIVLLFGVLVFATSWWTVIRPKPLVDNPSNRRALLEEQQIPRGLILARDGTVLARNHKLGSGETRRFERSYPQGDLFSHAIGYSFISHGRAGLEKSENGPLTGKQDEFTTAFEQLTGKKQVGNDLHTTLDTKAERVAVSALAGQKGSIVAIEPQSGRVRVLVSNPQYDPNQVPTDYPQLTRAEGSPLFNRATQARYPPGSTFKVVTAAAALDTGRYTPDSTVDGSNNKVIGGVPLQNFGGEDFGPISLTDALTHSVNTVWGQVGESLGKKTMFRYMRRFGFNKEPELDYPSEQMTPSGVFKSPTSPRILGPGDAVDIGRVAIGQERLQVTPLQMAEVAAAIANHGALMKPRLVEEVVAPDGRVVDRIRPAKQADVMSAKAASDLAGMMTQVVKSGTGTAAALSGIDVAGKTGTAEVPGGFNQAWFIAFAPVDNPQVAIAVTVERTNQSQTGGEVAAPLAKQVMQALLGGGQ